MTKPIFWLLVWAAMFTWGSVSCDSGDDSENGGDGDADGDADTDTDSDSDNDTDDGELLPDGALCRVNDQCESGYCESYWTAPPDPDAVCTQGLPQGQIRLLGNVRDFVTDELMTGVSVKIAGALPTLQDPVNAPALATATTDGNGLFTVEGGEKMTSEPVGLIAHVSPSGYFLSVTGLVEPEIGGSIYPPGARNHDVWAVPNTYMQVITQILEANGLEAYTPFGEKGGVIGRVRDADTGEPPAAPITLVSRHPATQAIVRYLNDDETGFSEQTGATGVFLIFNASLAEKFDAYRNGEIVSIHESTVGNSAKAAYITTIQVDED